MKLHYYKYNIKTIEMFNDNREILCTRLAKYDEYDISKLNGLALKCDWFIHETQIVNITSTDKPKYIFISNFLGNITIPYFVNNILPNINHSIIIIIASEDYTFPKGDKDCRDNFYYDKQDIVYTLINSIYVKRIFVENLDTIHPKLYPLPLGILEEKKIYYNDLIIENTKTPKITDREINVFCCHRNRQDTDSCKQWNDRKIVTDLCLTKWSNFVTYKDQIDVIEFKETLLKSKFCICVHGGGIDPSPRVWEALLCGSIPIIQRSTLDEAYSRFPIVYIDEWTEDCITEEKLVQWMEKYKTYYENIDKRNNVLNMLTLEYWWNIIKKSMS